MRRDLAGTDSDRGQGSSIGRADTSEKKKRIRQYYIMTSCDNLYISEMMKGLSSRATEVVRLPTSLPTYLPIHDSGDILHLETSYNVPHLEFLLVRQGTPTMISFVTET